MIPAKLLTHIFIVVVQTICTLAAFFDTEHYDSNSFEVCCFPFQPAQSNICLLKSTVSI